MRRSIATVSLSGNLEEKLVAIAAAKFDAVEVFENDLLFFDGTARDARRMADGLGLKIALFQPFRDFEAMPEAQFRRNLDRAERKFDLMGDLGATMMLVCSNVSPLALDDDALAAAQLHELAERAAARGIRIGYEALAWGAHVNTYGKVWRIVQAANHSHLGVILDSFHTIAIGDDPAGIAKIPGDKIFFVQLADAPKLSMDLLSWSRHFRCFPGQGEFDVAGFAAAAIDAGYSGPLSLEIFNDEFRAAAPAPTRRDGMRSLLFLEEADPASEPPADAAAAEGPQRVDLLDPPAAPDILGVAFLEFAVNTTALPELTGWLEGMGLRPRGPPPGEGRDPLPPGRPGDRAELRRATPSPTPTGCSTASRCAPSACVSPTPRRCSTAPRCWAASASRSGSGRTRRRCRGSGAGRQPDLCGGARLRPGRPTSYASAPPRPRPAPSPGSTTWARRCRATGSTAGCSTIAPCWGCSRRSPGCCPTPTAW
jgi:sugar phosphate isomerase/epimerase